MTYMIALALGVIALNLAVFWGVPVAAWSAPRDWPIQLIRNRRSAR